MFRRRYAALIYAEQGDNENGRILDFEDGSTTNNSPARILYHEFGHGGQHLDKNYDFIGNSKSKSLKKEGMTNKEYKNERNKWKNQGEKDAIKRENAVYGKKGGVRPMFYPSKEVMKRVKSPLEVPTR